VYKNNVISVTVPNVTGVRNVTSTPNVPKMTKNHSWIVKICSFCHAARIDMPFCFLIQNFAEIGQLIDELWSKNRFSKWRLSPS